MEEIGAEMIRSNLRQVVLGASTIFNHSTRRTTSTDSSRQDAGVDFADAVRTKVLAAEMTLFLKVRERLVDVMFSTASDFTLRRKR